MPVKKLGPGQWQWGTQGTVYPTKRQAQAQGRAAYAAGYKPKEKKK